MVVMSTSLGRICNDNGIKTVADLFTEQAMQIAELDILRSMSKYAKPEATLSFLAA